MTGHASRPWRFATWRYLRWALALPVLPLALWACNSHPLEQPVPQPELQNDDYYEVNPIRDVDILFMVDNSFSMNEEQQSLARNFPAMMNVLKNLPGGLPNVHIAVVSSDVGAGKEPPKGVAACAPRVDTGLNGDRGMFRVNGNCGLDPNARFLRSVAGGTQNNFSGDISTVFGCLATLGDTGCGFEHQLESTRLALYDPEKMNQGFLRRDAYLAIVYITDEDDCSAALDTTMFGDDRMGEAASLRCALEGHVCNGQKPSAQGFTAPLSACKPADSGKLTKVQDFVEAIRKVKARPDQLMVFGIFGWPENEKSFQYEIAKNQNNEMDYSPACNKPGYGKATPAVRMKTFVDSFGENNWFNICQGELVEPMKRIGDKIAARIGASCVSQPVLDKDGNDKNGVQPECSVADRRIVNDKSVDAPIPSCEAAGGAKPCWRLTPDVTCNSGSGYKVDVDRGNMMPPVGTQQIIKCLSCANPADTRCRRP